MPQWHPNPSVHEALNRLLEALASDERASRNRTLLVFIPEESETPPLIADSGNPLSDAALMTSETVAERIRETLETFHGQGPYRPFAR